MQTERVDRSAIGQLRQHTTTSERGGDIIGNGLIAGEIWRTLARDDGGELRIWKLVVLGDGEMGIDFISGPEMCAGHEDRDLAGGIRQV